MARGKRLPWPGWAVVRARIWEKAEELHAGDFYKVHEENIAPPTRSELREEGYFHRAKILVLRKINRELRGRDPRDDFTPPTLEEWESVQRGD